MPDVNPGQRFAWMTLDELAERTGRNVRLLRRWARDERFPAVRAGRAYLVDESVVAIVEAMPHRGWPKGKPRAKP
jgi:excisionase family DNA binding protein